MVPAAKKEIMERVMETVHPVDYLDYREYLSALYDALKANLEGYSYLEFAEDLGFSRTNVLHQVIKGRRPLSVKAAMKIIQSLGIIGKQRQYLEKLVSYQNNNDSIEREILFKKMIEIKEATLASETSKVSLEFFSEWYHIAIYEMVEFKVFKPDPHWIAAHVVPRIRPEQARKSLALLEQIGLIKFNGESNRYEHTQTRITTGEEIASLAIIRFQQRMIEIGRESLTMLHENDRDVSAVSFAIPVDMFARFKEEVKSFRKRMLELAEQSANKEVVCQMNIQLFPLTKPAKEDDK
jgi:uncharacterized protein (TIGR02147 family)